MGTVTDTSMRPLCSAGRNERLARQLNASSSSTLPAGGVAQIVAGQLGAEGSPPVTARRIPASEVRAQKPGTQRVDALGLAANLLRCAGSRLRLQYRRGVRSAGGEDLHVALEAPGRAVRP